MRYIGIDYGLKFVGLALSDEEGRMAFPERVLAYGKSIAEEIKNICQQKNVNGIVIGESKDFQGNENEVMKHIHLFREEVAQLTQLPTYLEPEFLTSHQAAKPQGKPIKTRGATSKNDMIHASAAALILQSFLDRQQNEVENQKKN